MLFDGAVAGAAESAVVAEVKVTRNGQYSLRHILYEST